MMPLPAAIHDCLTALEPHPAYLVGGCVRDRLLGLQPSDYDICTAATPEQIKEIFRDHKLVLSGEKHGTIGVVTDDGVVEITTFRTEGSYGDHRHPDRVTFVGSIEEDLARRDFTVNAIAYSLHSGLQDPFRGACDLRNQILRAVGDPCERFAEDSLRILRGVRFAVRFGLQPEEQTLQAMIAQAPLMDALARERVFAELDRLLLQISAAQLLQFRQILTQPLPELGRCMDFDQHSPHHAYDVYTHSAHVVEHVPAEPALRWAALLHDVGKVNTFTMDEQGRGHFLGHAKESARLADEILHRLRSPKALRERVVQLIELHMTRIPPEKKAVRRWMGRLGADLLEDLLLLQEADMCSKGIDKPAELSQFVEIRRLVTQIQAENACLTVRQLVVNGHDLMALGITGPQIGQTLNALLEQVLEDKLPNEKQALLAAAQAFTTST